MEDELHFLIVFPKYKLLRHELFRKVGERNTHFNSYNDRQKLIWLLSSENPDDIRDMGHFILLAIEQRNP